MRSGEVYNSACLKPSIKQSSDMVGACISASHVLDLVKIVWIMNAEKYCQNLTNQIWIMQRCLERVGFVTASFSSITMTQHTPRQWSRPVLKNTNILVLSVMNCPHQSSALLKQCGITLTGCNKRQTTSKEELWMSFKKTIWEITKSYSDLWNLWRK